MRIHARFLRAAAVALALCLLPPLSAPADTLRLPADLRTIEAQAFMNDTSLEEVTLPEGLESIGSQAFAGSSLRRIYLPASLERIAEDAFAGCQAVGWGPDGTAASAFFDSHPGLSFEHPTPEFTFAALSAVTCAVTGYTGESDTVRVPDRDPEGRAVTAVGESAFAVASTATDLRPLREVILPDTVVSIGADAFRSCGQLLSVNLPAGVIAIGAAAFSGCGQLLSADLPAALESIGPEAFAYCSLIREAAMPQGLRSLGARAFTRCDNLRAVSLPDSVTDLGASAFAECYSLTSARLSRGLTSLPEGLFAMCWSLDTVVIPPEITSIAGNAFYGCSGVTVVCAPGSEAERFADSHGMGKRLTDSF